MQVIVTEDYESLSRIGAEKMAAVIRENPRAALLLATGSTPIGMYRELAAYRQRMGLDTSRLRIFQLDSYLGLTPDDPRSLYRWLDQEFLQPLGILNSQVTRLPGDTADPAATCRAYDRAVAEAGGIDLSVLGLGPNGHLGFNEPPSQPGDPTRQVTLTEASIESNSVYWGGREQVPPQALTAGMAVLLAARQTLLVVSGAHKQGILDRALNGPITPDVPASYLRQAPDLTIIADRAALPEKKRHDR